MIPNLDHPRSIYVVMNSDNQPFGAFTSRSEMLKAVSKLPSNSGIFAFVVPNGQLGGGVKIVFPLVVEQKGGLLESGDPARSSS